MDILSDTQAYVKKTLSPPTGTPPAALLKGAPIKIFERGIDFFNFICYKIKDKPRKQREE
jgi:hypothetical protein